MFRVWGCEVGNRSACAVNRVTDKQHCFIKFYKLLHFIELTLTRQLFVVNTLLVELYVDLI